MKKIVLALLAAALMMSTALAVSRDEAAEIARNATGGAEVVRTERDDGVYEVELRDENARYEVQVRGSDGAVLELETSYPGAGRGKSFALTEAEARERAAAVAPEAAEGVVSRERGGEGDVYELFYAADAAVGQVEVNAQAGAIVRTATYPEAARQGVLSVEDVEKRVSERLPGARVTELEIEWDEGRYVYSGEAASADGRYEFEMNAGSGEFLEVERAGA